MSAQHREYSTVFGIMLLFGSFASQAFGTVPLGRFESVRAVPGLVTKHQHVAPMLTDDQLTIYFTSFDPAPASFPADNPARNIWTASRQSKDEAFGEPSLIDSPISVDGVADYHPSISGDGLSLYFMSYREEGLPGTTYPWVTKRDSIGTSWQEPEIVIGSFHTLEDGLDIDVSSVSFSSDDLTMYFQTRRNGTYDILQTHRDSIDSEFGSAEPVFEEAVNAYVDQHGQLTPRVSSDGLTLVLAYWEDDAVQEPWPEIHIATRESVDERFGEPINIDAFGLGSNLNRSGAEFSPFLSADFPADGSKLYYADGATANWTLYEATWSLPCDIDRNGRCNVNDLDEFYEAGDLIAGVPKVSTNERLDFTGDDVIDTRDLAVWRESAAIANGFSVAYQTGDTNLDGRVDAEDLNVVGLNWAQEADGWSDGDFSGDGQVTAEDLNFVGLNWQSSIATAPLAVPEPCGMSWWYLALFAWAGLRKSWTR